MLKLYQAYMSGAIINIFQTFSTVYQLNFMVQNNCNIEQIFYDLSSYCMTADCSMQHIISSLTTKFFQITGSINSIAEQIAATQPDITNTQANFNMYATMGQSVGKIVRITMDFKWYR